VPDDPVPLPVPAVPLDPLDPLATVPLTTVTVTEPCDGT
jgi:hypothetical protein